jgi:glycosyltransferase
MKISIITATFNSEITIAGCISSVNSQIHQDIEHIIVDGASKDNTIEIVKNTPNRSVKLISEPDKGIYDALNKGVKQSTGDIIGFLHSDDMLASPQTIQNIVDSFSFPLNPDKNKAGKETSLEKVDVLYGDLVYVDKDNPKRIIRYWKSQPFHPALLLRGWMPAHPTVFMRREVYEKHGFYDLSIKIAADYDYLLRVFSDPTLRFVYLPEVITKMRLGGISNRGFKNMIHKSKEDYQAILKNKMPYPIWVLFIKIVSKIPQYFGNR